MIQKDPDPRGELKRTFFGMISARWIRICGLDPRTPLSRLIIHPSSRAERRHINFLQPISKAGGLMPNRQSNTLTSVNHQWFISLWKVRSLNLGSNDWCECPGRCKKFWETCRKSFPDIVSKRLRDGPFWQKVATENPMEGLRCCEACGPTSPACRWVSELATCEVSRK